MTKRAIVLGGGGSRGPYQVGVWRALRELGVDYSIVTGSSVGALNGALMVQGDYDVAREMWESISLKDVIADATVLDAADTVRMLPTLLARSVTQGGLDISPLEEHVRAALDERRIRESAVDYGLVTAQYPLMRPIQLTKEEIPEGALLDYVLASSSWFPFFRRRTIDGVDYVDGAYADNLPAELAARCGADEIIAVDLQGIGFVRAFKRDIPVRYIRSHWGLGDMLLFDPENARRNMRLGYRDGLKAFRRLEGNAYTFPPGDTRKNVTLLRRALDDIRRRTGVSLFKQRERLPRIQEMLRYRNIDQRFLGRRTGSPTLGCAVTTAAEITGELLQIPPDHTYRLRAFNKLILEQAALLEHASGGAWDRGLFDAITPAGRQMNRRSRGTLLRMHGLLRDGYRAGRVADAFWRMAAISPIEFVAANYLLALELHYGLEEGAKG